MRHQGSRNSDRFDTVDIAAVWPASAQVAPLPLPDVDAAEPALATGAVPDLPAAVGTLIVGSYAVLIAAFALATVSSRESIFMIVIAAFFAVMFFGVPRLFLAIEPKTGPARSLARFMDEGMETLTGHSSGKAALVQMLIVPVFLTGAVIAMGIAAALIF
jgi:hypothetical protein